jgi:hypothetical protein
LSKSILLTLKKIKITCLVAIGLAAGMANTVVAKSDDTADTNYSIIGTIINPLVAKSDETTDLENSTIRTAPNPVANNQNKSAYQSKFLSVNPFKFPIVNEENEKYTFKYDGLILKIEPKKDDSWTTGLTKVGAGATREFVGYVRAAIFPTSASHYLKDERKKDDSWTTRLTKVGAGATLQFVVYGCAAILPTFAFHSNQSKKAANFSVILNSGFTYNLIPVFAQIIALRGTFLAWHGIIGGPSPKDDDINFAENFIKITNALVYFALNATATNYAWYYWENGNEYYRGVNIATTLAAVIFIAASSNFAALATLLDL